MSINRLLWLIIIVPYSSLKKNVRTLFFKKPSEKAILQFHTGLEQIKEIIYRATTALCRYLDPSRILIELKASLILTDDDVHVIKSHPSMEEMVDELLTMLKRKSEEGYFCLMEALRNLRPDLFKKIVDIERACITGSMLFCIT